jgi:phosphonopyruvate decarboxylase
VLTTVKEQKTLSFIEIKTAAGAREDLGRPSSAPRENKEQFMKFIQGASNA